MPVNSTHADYDLNADVWRRSRDVHAGEDAVKDGGERYLPRLDSQSDDEYAAYKLRTSFFNATARTVGGFVGLIFRREMALRLPKAGAGVGNAMRDLQADCDLLGTTLEAYAKALTEEVLLVGRAGTLIEWEDTGEDRSYLVAYRAEQILNWRTERVRGRNRVTMVVLREMAESGVSSQDSGDEFEDATVEQIRVLKLLHEGEALRYVVEVWRPETLKGGKTEWQLAETRTPLRHGRPLAGIPFVFHGPTHSRPEVEKPPMLDIVAVNLDHYRLNADYKHGLHFTALPTAWVSGFDKTASLRIGSTTAWVTESVGATAGYLEFKGDGLGSFERAMDRAERQIAVLGSRMLEAQKRVGESAEALELRQSAENSVLSGLAVSLSESLTMALRWAYWWHSTEERPEDVSGEVVSLGLNTDFSDAGMTSDEVIAVVSAWQANAISTATMRDIFRRGEIIPPGRSNAEEDALVRADRKESAVGSQDSGAEKPRRLSPASKVAEVEVDTRP
jgi:hypothetical protein